MRSLLVAILLVSACGKNNEPPPPTSGSPNAQPESGPSRPRPSAPMAAAPADDGTRAQKMFAMMCVMCHGADGTGTGPMAATLNPKPRNYTDAKWQAETTDDQIKEIILKGGAGVGKSVSMPAHPELADQQDLLNGLVQVIRKFGKS